jgi:hypothetical protein
LFGKETDLNGAKIRRVIAGFEPELNRVLPKGPP